MMNFLNNTMSLSNFEQGETKGMMKHQLLKSLKFKRLKKPLKLLTKTYARLSQMKYCKP